MDALEAYCAAVEARTEAERTVELAAGAGTELEQASAELDLELARQAVEAARDRVGGAFCQMFRCALDACEPFLNVLVERLMNTAAVTLAEQRAEYAERACAWAVTEIDRLKAENWDLARELVRVSRRLEALEYEQERVADTTAAQRPARREPAGVG